MLPPVSATPEVKMRLPEMPRKRQELSLNAFPMVLIGRDPIPLVWIARPGAPATTGEASQSSPASSSAALKVFPPLVPKYVINILDRVSRVWLRPSPESCLHRLLAEVEKTYRK